MKNRLFILSIFPLLLSSCANEISFSRAKEIVANYDKSSITAKGGSISTYVQTLYGIGEHGSPFLIDKLAQGYYTGLSQIKKISEVQILDYQITKSSLEEYAYKNDYDLKYIVDNKRLTITRDSKKTLEKDGYDNYYLKICYDETGLLKSFNESISVRYNSEDYYIFNYTYYTTWNY